MDEQVREDMRELKQDVKELIRQSAVHNELLRTHEARSLALQEQVKLQAQKMEPIQKHVDVVNMLGKSALAIITGVLVYGLSRWFF